MKNPTSVIVIIFFSLLFSCSRQNTVEVSRFEPLGQVDKLTTFKVEFTEALAPKNMLDTWVTDEYIEFEPRIIGKFKWIDSRTLLFSPDYPLEPIQNYTARINRNVLFDTPYDLDGDEYTFRTADFDLVKVDFFWSPIPNQNYILSIKANLHFNYPVHPDKLRDFLEIKLDGKSLDIYKIVTESSSDIIALDLGEVTQSQSAQEIEMKIKKGLMSVIGKKPMEDDRNFDYDLPPVTRLAITGLSSGFDGSTGWINVFTTQKVDEKVLSKYVSIEPRKDLSFYVSDNQFRIEADLQGLQTVNVIINKGLPGLYGGELEFDFEQMVSLVNLNPSINFTDKKGKYLMYLGEKNLELNIVNIDKAELEVSQVFKNNVLHFIDRYSYLYEYDNSYYNPYISPDNFGREIYSEKIDLSGNKNWLERITIDLDRALRNEYRGIYVVNVRSDEDRWVQDSRIVAITDLGLIVKKSPDQINVFVNSIKSAEPVSNVSVNIISSNNQILLTGTTDHSGSLVFDNAEERIEGFTPRLVTAELNDDFNYLDLKESYVDYSRFDIGGITEYSSGYKVFVYGDRNIYRPGETVNLSAIVRNKNMDVVKDIPVIVKIINPRGKIFEEYRASLNAQGSFELSFVIPDYALTGQYSAEIYSGTQALISAYKFNIEDFVPDKLRLSLNADKKSLSPGESVTIHAESEFLFGAPAGNLAYEAEIQLKHRNFRSETFPDFDFASSSIINQPFENTFMDGRLDASGETDLKYVVPRGIVSSGIISGAVYLSVFDLTGRTVNRGIGFDIYTRDYFMGIQSSGYYFGTNERINFRIAAVDQEDKKLNSLEATCRLVRYEWQTVLKKDYANRYYYASEEKEIVEWERDVKINNGTAELTAALEKAGKYELRVNKKGDDFYNKKEFYAYGWMSSTASSFQVDREGRVEILPDKQVYTPGEKAKVLFMTPFSGRMLVTFERDGIYEYKYINVENRSAELEVEITNTFLPNVYVSATLFKPHNSDNKMPLLVGHGVFSLKVEQLSNKLSVDINAPEKIKPNTRQKISVKTLSKKDVHVTVAVVDEGILQINNFTSPDPYDHMYAKRSLNVESYDLYKLLLPEIVSSSSSTGGDALADRLKKRTNPITSKRFKLVSSWSGIKKTDINGMVDVEIDVPQFNGELRVMAVAYTDEKFGSSSKAIKVAGDLIIESEIPRVMSLGDTLVSVTTVINNQDTPVRLELGAIADGALKAVPPESRQISMPAGGTGKAAFTFIAEEVGISHLKIAASPFDTREETEISVRPVSPYIVESGYGTIKGGEEKSLFIPGGFMESTKNMRMILTNFPAIQYSKQLKSLVGYPHGCIEQTVSKLFPQLYFEDIAKLAAPELYRTYNPVYFVNEGIKKIEAMQIYDGSMAYWQGGNTSSWWGSVYAAHFLIEASKAEYNINPEVLNSLLNYLAKRTKEKSTYDYVEYVNNSRTVRKIADKEIIYSLYVLALSGRGDMATMNYYKSRPHLLSFDTKYLLAGAYALMGKRNSFADLIPELFEPVNTLRLSGGNFDSEARANAIMLNVLLEVDPSNDQIPFMVNHIAGLTGGLYSTQEKAFVFLGLGKAARRNSGNDLKITLRVEDETVGIYENKDLIIDDKNLTGKEFKMKCEGTGEAYYYWSAEGVKSEGKIKDEDRNMKLRRTYFDYKTGNQISDNKFEQGQMILCRIALTGFEQSAENIVITDMVPACFEIENPRISESADANFANPAPMNVEFTDIRDDRLILIAKLERNRTVYYNYLVRAVSKGSFMLPGIAGDAMYTPEFYSYHGAGRVKVSEK